MVMCDTMIKWTNFRIHIEYHQRVPIGMGMVKACIS